MPRQVPSTHDTVPRVQSHTPLVPPMQRAIHSALSAPAVDAGPDAMGEPDALVDAGGPDARPTTFGGARPATLVVPASYDPATPTPLVLVLHGYSTNTTYAAPLLQLTAAASSAGFLMIAPAGTADSSGGPALNARMCGA